MRVTDTDPHLIDVLAGREHAAPPAPDDYNGTPLGCESDVRHVFPIERGHDDERSSER